MQPSPPSVSRTFSPFPSKTRYPLNTNNPSLIPPVPGNNHITFCFCEFDHPRYLIWRRQWHPTPVLLPGKSHGWRSLVGCSPWGRWESDTTERLHFHVSLSCIGEGNGNPLQCSCLENPRDGGAWWVAVYGVAQSRTWLKQLSSSSSRYLIWVSQVVLVVKNPPADAGDARDVHSIPGSGKSPGGRQGNPLQYSCLENPMDRGAWRATVPRVTKSQTRRKWLSTNTQLSHISGILQCFFCDISFGIISSRIICVHMSEFPSFQS